MMSSRASRARLLAVLLVSLAGCQCSTSIEPEAPPRIPPPDRVVKIGRSTVFIPVQIPVSELEALVNDVVPDSLYSTRDEKIRGGLFPIKMDLDITREGKIQSTTVEGVVSNMLPIRAKGRVRLPPGIWRPFDAAFTILAQTDLTLHEDWRTVARTRGDFTWQESPYITLLGIKIGLKGKAENALRDQLQQLAPKIDGLIAEKINLRKEATKIWDSIGEPIQIRSDPPTWLLISPVGTYFSQAVSRSDTFVVGLNVEAELETVVGQAPTHVLADTLPPLIPLPDSLAQQDGRGFQMYLPLTITYEQARDLLLKSLGDKTLNVQEKVSVNIDDVDLYPSGPSVIARMDFRANLADPKLGTSGRICLEGLPRYDIVTRTISVDSLDYDLNTRDALAKAAEWFLHGTLLELTRERLSFPIGEEIDKIAQQLSSALRSRQLGKHIVLDGVITQFLPSDIYLTEDGINIDVFVRGTMIARVRGLDEVL